MRAVDDTRYNLYVIGFDTSPRLTPLDFVFWVTLNNLEFQASRHGTEIPNIFVPSETLFVPEGAVVLSWFNQCNMTYGSYNDLKPIVQTLRDVLTVPGIMPTERQSNRCIYFVTRVPEDGTQEVRIGDGVVWGTNEKPAN